MNPLPCPGLLTRRQFLGGSACSGMGTAGLLHTILALRGLNAQTIDSLPADAPYKALVCVFHYGGNDSNNLLIPRAASAHQKYLANRTVIGLPLSGILPLDSLNDSGLELGLHGSMSGCQALYNQGNLALLANLGTLIAPITLADYRNRTAAIPDNLFSHSDQQIAWQTSASSMNAAYNQTGWGGRLAESLMEGQERQSISMLISLSGTNFFQVGKTMLPFRPGPGGTPTFKLGQSSRSQDVTRYAAFRSILDAEHANLMEDAFSDLSNKSIIEADTINAALQGTGSFPTLPNTDLGNQLRTVAKFIQAAGPLGMRRQIFFVSNGGYDLHGDFIAPHAQLLGGVSGALKGFYDALASIGMTNAVTTFTASDFNRTYDSNGRGSDHGWGGHYMVMGGAVRGRRIYGSYPDPDILAGNNPLDTGRGRWVPTLGVDPYAATLAKWFGLPGSRMRDVFPNIGNFDPDIGFMNA